MILKKDEGQFLFLQKQVILPVKIVFLLSSFLLLLLLLVPLLSLSAEIDVLVQLLFRLLSSSSTLFWLSDSSVFSLFAEVVLTPNFRKRRNRI
jgi:hypothetical protein